MYRACRVDLARPVPFAVTSDMSRGIDKTLWEWVETAPRDYVFCSAMPSARAASGCQCGFSAASGDWTLAERRHWFAVRGYPELRLNHEMDAVGLAKLLRANGGHWEITLDWPVFHQPHSRYANKSTIHGHALCDVLCTSENPRGHSWSSAVYNVTWGLLHYQLREKLIP